MVKNEYDVVKFQVPHVVWRQALRPTPPILKSPVTITLPINVQDEENEVDDELEDAEEEVVDNVSVDASLVDNEEGVPVEDEIVTPTPPLQDPIVEAPAPAAPTEAPVVQDEIVEEPQEDVPGQVTRFPCSCLDGQCGCCTGAIMERFRMKTCGNMTFVPEDFIFDVKLSVNNNTVIRRRVSGNSFYLDSALQDNVCDCCENGELFKRLSLFQRVIHHQFASIPEELHLSEFAPKYQT